MTEHRALTHTVLRLCSQVFSTMRIQVSSALLKVTQKMKGAIPQTLSKNLRASA